MIDAHSVVGSAGVGYGSAGAVARRIHRNRHPTATFSEDCGCRRVVMIALRKVKRVLGLLPS
jgi:hypothetical protein